MTEEMIEIPAVPTSQFSLTDQYGETEIIIASPPPRLQVPVYILIIHVKDTKNQGKIPRCFR